MAGQSAPEPAFDEQLVLFRFLLNYVGIESLSALSYTLNDAGYEGINESGNTYFFEYFSTLCKLNRSALSLDTLRMYDENICRHTRQISEKRGSLK